VTEYHGGLKCLTRVRLRYRFVTTTVILNLLFLAIIIYRNLNSAGVDLRLLMAYGVFLLFLGTRARRLKRRVAEIVDVAACRAGLLPIRKGKIAHAVR
jgi:hypothetical protein